MREGGKEGSHNRRPFHGMFWSWDGLQCCPAMSQGGWNFVLGPSCHWLGTLPVKEMWVWARQPWLRVTLREERSWEPLAANTWPLRKRGLHWWRGDLVAHCRTATPTIKWEFTPHPLVQISNSGDLNGLAKFWMNIPSQYLAWSETAGAANKARLLQAHGADRDRCLAEVINIKERTRMLLWES